MEKIDSQIQEIINGMPPIGLDEMESIRLMNRLDTKFVTTKRHLIELLGMLQGKYYSQDIHSIRICPYRTTYFDTDDHAQYMQHHNKKGHRTKVRVRTYLVDGDVTFLEVKGKNNHGRTKKKRIRIDSLERAQETEGVCELVHRKTGFQFKSMHPVVQNLFDRITLVNMSKTERLTIDFNIRFHNFETGLDADSDQLVIVELKRDGNVFSPVTNLLRDLHIHPTGFSKCCIGMCWTDPDLRQNNFKAKIRRLKKINNA
ncbi:MAG: polyphosphate polymerase domain-containing protein [Bacteroidaceae bacterium]|nr:polyphosphate polymerase domain-containing protein [Bacteroidaceae bacterium]